jgi:hypothetical protein
MAVDETAEIHIAGPSADVAVYLFDPIKDPTLDRWDLPRLRPPPVRTHASVDNGEPIGSFRVRRSIGRGAGVRRNVNKPERGSGRRGIWYRIPDSA